MSDLADFGLTPAAADQLLDLAEAAIRARLVGDPPPRVDVPALPPQLRRPLGAFVTLHVRGELNGCIGHIIGTAPIAAGVAELAVSSAFHDPRLPALRADDLDDLDIEISLLSVPAPVPARTRAELVGRLRPGVDGLILSSGGHSAVFLPTVWQQLPDPDDFVDRLLLKARLPTDRWPDDMRAELFTTAIFARRVVPDGVRHHP